MEVKALLDFKWRDKWYKKGAVLPVNEKQGKDLVAAGLAKYDSGDKEQDKPATLKAKKHKEDCGCGGKKKPTEKNTVSEIKEYLDGKNIAYTSSMNKADLLELI